ncbi:MAG: cell division protein FtsL [Verrucomicrobia bacterium]|jgi:cell division protein FtsB|nr:cell division protein FtsL [Verrucomicrobiota bacterium]
MARNRRHQSAAIRFGPALKAVVLCLAIGGSAVGYVWQKDQLRQLGDRMVSGERSLDALRRQNDKLRRELVTLQSPAYLERLAQQHNLGLVRPAPNQVIRLPEPGEFPEIPAVLSGSAQFAARGSQEDWSR